MSFKKYAKYYDTLYSDKDYGAECDFIEKIFETFADPQPKTILDVGCGTGGHLIPLLKRGYDVIGIDSAEKMVSIARSKVGDWKDPRIFEEEFQNFSLGKKFDSVICMFSVLNYIVETEELLKGLKNIRKHLHKGGLFIADFWYGPAVLNIKPSVRIKEVDTGDMKILRMITPEIDTFYHIHKSHYSMMIHNDKEILDYFQETHVLRYYFPQELIWYLEQAGFEVLQICEFMRLWEGPTDDTWDACVIAEAV